MQADAQARIAGAALLPSLSGAGQETYSRTSGSSASGLTNGGREVVNYSSSLSASYELDFWGKNRDAAQAAEETANANRFDRDVVALTTLTSVANAYFQVLAAQDRIRTAERNIASATRILDAIKQRLQGRHRDRPRRRAAGKRARQSARGRAAAAADAGAEHQRARDAGVAAAGKRARHRRFAQPDRLAARHAGPAVGIVDAAAGHPPSGGAARVGHRQRRQRACAVFPEHSIDRAGRLSELGAGRAVPAPCGIFQPRRRTDAADLRRRQNPRQFRIHKAKQDELLQTYRKTVVSAFADVDNALVAIRQTTERLRLQREVVAASRRAFELSEQQLRAGTADIVTVLNTQLTLFQAEDLLSQAQLARLAGNRQPVSGAGRRLGAEDGEAGQCSLSRI